jgi:hypothetical protein
MSHNVQKYDRQVYLRVSEAQRCRVHSTLVMPLFGAASAGPDARPVAVFELVQADRDVAFPSVIAELRKCLRVRGQMLCFVIPAAGLCIVSIIAELRKCLWVRGLGLLDSGCWALAMAWCSF